MSPKLINGQISERISKSDNNCQSSIRNVQVLLGMRILALTYHDFDGLASSLLGIRVQVFVDSLADEIESTCSQVAVVLHIAPNLVSFKWYVRNHRSMR